MPHFWIHKVRFHSWYAADLTFHLVVVSSAGAFRRQYEQASFLGSFQCAWTVPFPPMPPVFGSPGCGGLVARGTLRPMFIDKRPVSRKNNTSSSLYPERSPDFSVMRHSADRWQIWHRHFIWLHTLPTPNVVWAYSVTFGTNGAKNHKAYGDICGRSSVRSS